MSNKQLGSMAVFKALELRKNLKIPMTSPVSPFNVCDELGVHIQFLSIDKPEGLCIAEEKSILISTRRPAVRQSFTCAHELGHYILGHGTVLDELIENGSREDDPMEYQANVFAGSFLMPKVAVGDICKKEGIDWSNLNAVEAYKLSSYFGVGYSTILNHLIYRLDVLSKNSGKTLLAKKPKDIKKAIFADFKDGNLVYVSKNWAGDKAIDIEVGDIVVCDFQASTESEHMRIIKNEDNKTVFQALQQGKSRIHDNADWASFVRIARREYEGMFQYMYEEGDESYE